MIRKAIIPLAGKGTRMRPISGVIAKEMLPLGTTPALEWVICEAIDSGIDQLLLIITPEKAVIPQYLVGTANPVPYEQGGTGYTLQRHGHTVSVAFTYQGQTSGSGAAVLCGADWTQGETVAVLFGDDIIVGNPPATRQLLDVSEMHGACSVLGVQAHNEQLVRTCAVIDPSGGNGDGEVRHIIEKPQGSLPSHLTSLGRFVVSPDGMRALAATPLHNGELWLTEALDTENQTHSVRYCRFVGRRYDIGNPLGYRQAFVELSLQGEEQHRLYDEYIARCAVEKDSR